MIRALPVTCLSLLVLLVSAAAFRGCSRGGKSRFLPTIRLATHHKAVQTSDGYSGFRQGAFGRQPEGLSDEDVRNLARRRYLAAFDNSAFFSGVQVDDSYPLKGKVVAITGAAGGIGRALSNVVVSVLGGDVVAMDIDELGLSKLASDLNSEAVPGRVIPVKVDHANLDSVRSAAISIRMDFPRIDLLVNNAGLCYDFPNADIDKAGSTAQGHDLLFGVNYLSHVLLTELLMPCLLRADGGGRVVQVTSGYHAMVDGSMLVPSNPKIEKEELAEIEVTSLNSSKNENDPSSPPASRGPRQGRWSRHVSRAYANSKMAQIWHARSLARDPRTQRSACGHSNSVVPKGEPLVTAVCACPSWVSTGIAGDSGRDMLARLAFPACRGGAGITSVLNAMFRRDDELGDDILSEKAKCYVGNARVTENLAPLRSLW
eukprot:CAMPEP_0113544884 /NCGR_PEP_ID=MMETSP0015_2-20120614/10951_1 /TAXON_ID=2838 /ORGANISM="Odontella" /LENGTH=429 /DNA_ID=CAMNT_0000445183 /DNA_START=47 /DNA_END=1333 /DNA_ORIENTATION=+ /assembly_acc=CAM_ASM_000160